MKILPAIPATVGAQIAALFQSAGLHPDYALQGEELSQQALNKLTTFASTDKKNLALLEELVARLNPPQCSGAHNLQPFPKLELITRPTLKTAEAAFYLGLRDQTMRAHASKDDFPIRPIRINGRLHWKTSEIRALLSGEAK